MQCFGPEMLQGRGGGMDRRLQREWRFRIAALQFKCFKKNIVVRLAVSLVMQGSPSLGQNDCTEVEGEGVQR